MELVFISSIQRGFEEVRAAARAAVESLGLRAVMAETIGAADASPQTALLDRVASSDVFLLLIGSRYGAPAGGGISPTEGQGNRRELARAAQERAEELARGRDGERSHASALVRVALVPLVSSPLLDALALEDAALPDDLGDAARISPGSFPTRSASSLG